MTTKRSGPQRNGTAAGAIERAKGELERMMDLNPDVMVLVNRAGEMLRVNRSLLALLGLKRFSDVLGRRLGDLFPGAPASFCEELLSGGGGTAELTAALATGERLLRFRAVSARPDADVQVVIVYDVTDQEAATASREREYKREAVQTLMGGLMHRINQPLTVITVKARLLQLALGNRTLDPAELKSGLDDITDLVMQVSRLLERMEKPRDYVTEDYLDGLDVLDLDRSGQEGAGREESRPES